MTMYRLLSNLGPMGVAGSHATNCVIFICEALTHVVSSSLRKPLILQSIHFST